MEVNESHWMNVIVMQWIFMEGILSVYMKLGMVCGAWN
jgi:hypothetical protein